MFDLKFYKSLGLIIKNIEEIPAVKTRVIFNDSSYKKLIKQDHELHDIVQLTRLENVEYLHNYLKYFGGLYNKLDKIKYRNQYYTT